MKAGRSSVVMPNRNGPRGDDSLSSLLEHAELDEGELNVCFMYITPEIAKEWLANQRPNRLFRKGTKERYVRDMKLDQWELTHQGIAFDRLGRLADGQHRLHAIVATGKTIRCLVVRGLSEAACLAIDDGLRRSVQDVAKFSGKETARRAAATAMRMLQGMSSSSARETRREVLDFIDKHEAALDFVMECFPTKVNKITSSSVMAVFGRAYYSASREDLKRAAKILCNGVSDDGIMEDGDRTLVHLNRVLMAVDNHSGGTMRASVYARAERALQAFLDGQHITKIYEASEELFPLPGEEA